ncbi:hypothetical protein BLOT_012814 [Blomia tropicalis]|nr:hypothetical protein BLOT_012814 [Blomia tropicalis]
MDSRKSIQQNDKRKHFEQPSLPPLKRINLNEKMLSRISKDKIFSNQPVCSSSSNEDLSPLQQIRKNKKIKSDYEISNGDDLLGPKVIETPPKCRKNKLDFNDCDEDKSTQESYNVEPIVVNETKPSNLSLFSMVTSYTTKVQQTIQTIRKIMSSESSENKNILEDDQVEENTDDEESSLSDIDIDIDIPPQLEKISFDSKMNDHEQLVNKESEKERVTRNGNLPFLVSEESKVISNKEPSILPSNQSDNLSLNDSDFDDLFPDDDDDLQQLICQLEPNVENKEIIKTENKSVTVPIELNDNVKKSPVIDQDLSCEDESSLSSVEPVNFYSWKRNIHVVELPKSIDNSITILSNYYLALTSCKKLEEAMIRTNF